MENLKRNLKLERYCRKCNKEFFLNDITICNYLVNGYKFNRHYCYNCWVNIRRNNIKLKTICKFYNEKVARNVHICEAEPNIKTEQTHYRCKTLLEYYFIDNHLYYGFNKRMDYNTGGTREFNIYKDYVDESNLHNIKTFNDIIDAIKDYYWRDDFCYDTKTINFLKHLTKCKVSKGKYYITNEGYLNMAFKCDYNNKYYYVSIS